MADEDNEMGGAGLPPLENGPLRLPTIPCDASILLVGAVRKDVMIFLSPRSGSHPGVETVEEFLGADRDFIPVQLRDDDVSLLVNRRAILMLEVSADAPTLLSREENAGMPLEMVEVEMEGGERVSGAIRMHGPPLSQRISDEFNSDQLFLPLECGEKVVYFNTHRVTLVRL